MTLNRRDFFKGLGAVAGGAAALVAGVRKTVGAVREYDKVVREVADALPVLLAENMTGAWVELNNVRYAVDSYFISGVFHEPPPPDYDDYESWNFWAPVQRYWNIEFTTHANVDIDTLKVNAGPMPFVAGGVKDIKTYRGEVYFSNWNETLPDWKIHLTGTGPLIVEPA